MNLLQLVNKLIIESRVSGEPLQTTKNVRGETRRLVNYTQDAWLDIQQWCDKWAFLKVQASTSIPLNGSLLSPPEHAIGQVAEWDLDNFRIAEAARGRKDSQVLNYLDWDYFNNHTFLDPTRVGPPQNFSIDWRNEAIYIAPASDAIRTLFYEYWRTPQELVSDTDVPLMPSQFHRLIVWEALLKYAIDESAGETVQRAQKEISSLKLALWRDQGPGIVMQGLI